MRVLAKLDGTLADIDQPQLTVDDLGLLRGDGIFETILVVDGRPRELGPHLDRLARSADLLGLPAPDRVAWERSVRVVLDAWPGPEVMALRLRYPRGPASGDGTPTRYAMGGP